MSNEKYSGVLLPISSLPGKYGIGQIGKSAYNFIDFLASAKFKYWEILPLCPTNISNSPYQGTSLVGLNSYLIDFDLLVEEGLLNSRDFQGIDFGKNTRRIDYGKVFANSRVLLYKAYKRFNKEDPSFKKFCISKIFHDYSLYSALKELNGFKSWYDWRLEDRYFEPEVEEDLMKNHADLYYYYQFTQFIFCRQWTKLRNYAKSKGIRILGQVAHFIGYDSDEVYLHPEEFLLDKLGRMTLVAGFPPDEFSKDGQKWGEPLYDWNYMKTTHYKWWLNRLNYNMYFFDAVMINHFSGFFKVYGIPFRSKNAKKGEFVYTSGNEVIEKFKELKVFASDLGNTDTDVEKYIMNTGFPNLYTSGVAFFNKRKNSDKFLPSQVPENSLLYIGNHDNSPIRGELDRLDKDSKAFLKERIKSESAKLSIEGDINFDSTREIFNRVIEIVGKSKAKFVTYTMQDILYQGEDSRMNFPGSIDNRLNWTYRFLQSDITKITIEKWASLNELCNRAQ